MRYFLIISLVVVSLIGGNMGRLRYTGSPQVRNSNVAPSYPFGKLPIASRPSSGLPKATQLVTSPQAFLSMMDYIKKSQAAKMPLQVPNALPQQKKTPYQTPIGGYNPGFKKLR